MDLGGLERSRAMASRRAASARLSLSALALLYFALSASGKVEGENLVRHKRVLGGWSVSDPGESSWMVSLQGRDVKRSFLGIPLEYGTRYCGGTLINEYWILTAAHCFKGQNINEIPVSRWHVRVASPNLKATALEQLSSFFGRLLQLQDSSRATLHVEQIVVHPGYYSTDSWRNDIALVKLAERIPPSSMQRIVQFMPLPESGVRHYQWPVDGQVCRAYGWGCTRTGQPLSSQIMRVDLEKTSNVRCSLLWQVPTDSRLCAGGVQGQGRGACHGDSGGPLLCETSSGQAVQAGIISFVHSEDPENHPVVLTRVSHYVDWIRTVIGS